LKDPGRTLQDHLADLERSPWPGLAMTTDQRKSLRAMIIAMCKNPAESETGIALPKPMKSEQPAADQMVA
jgi:hypothetical protein